MLQKVQRRSLAGFDQQNVRGLRREGKQRDLTTASTQIDDLKLSARKASFVH